MRLVRDSEVVGKKVFLRADLDVPLKNGEIIDDFRLQKVLPTINYLVENKAKIILAGHLDRPGGEVVGKLRLDPIARWLRRRGFTSLRKLDDCVGDTVSAAVSKLSPGEIVLLENLRFHRQETENASQFARRLANLADLYVNDCFAAAHRQHASIVGVPRYLPSYAGVHLKEEVETLQTIALRARRPLLFIIGGAKAETKVPLVKKLTKIADTILLGGSLMFATSLDGTPKVIFPVDAVRIDDIGPKTIEIFKKEIQKAQTIVWNGPLGVTETEEFVKGSREIAHAVTAAAAFTVVGGGDTTALLSKFGLRDKIDFVSTGGGSMLEFLADGTLPGLEVLGWKKP